VALYWVKGHSQITRNEIADKTAKAGARWSRDDGIRYISTIWTLGLDPT
jgi:ribonuclease HI